MTDYEPLSEADKAEIRERCDAVAADGDTLSDYVHAAIASAENQRMADYWRARALVAEAQECPRCEEIQCGTCGGIG